MPHDIGLMPIDNPELRGRVVFNTELPSLPNNPIQGEMAFVKDHLYIFTINDLLSNEWKNLTIDLAGNGSATTAAKSDHNHDSVYYTKTELKSTSGTRTNVDWSQVANAPYIQNLDSSAIICDVKSAGTNGGGFTAKIWTTRVLNTITKNASWLILLDSSFTLSSGTYQFDISAPASYVNENKLRLRSTSDTLTTIYGTSEYSNSSNYVCKATLKCVLTINTTTTFVIEHYCNRTKASDGLGKCCNISGAIEVYSVVAINKLS